MSVRIAIAGTGAVSPAGWGVAPFAEALRCGEPLPFEIDDSEAWQVRVRRVPTAKHPLFRLPRLRRSSPVARFMAAAAVEALGEERMKNVAAGDLRLGVVATMLGGCVNYSRRFYREVLDDPATASPIVFPETVFNAPSSHLSAVLGSTAANYTLVGDAAEFLRGIDLAAQWIADGEVDGVLVVTGEEYDWLSAGAFALFAKGEAVVSEGAAALYLEASESPGIELVQVTDPVGFRCLDERAEAIRRVAGELRRDGLLVDSRGRGSRYDRAEEAAWRNGARISPGMVFGDGLAVLSGWQCVAAVEMAERDVVVLAAGLNEQCAGVRFRKN